MQTEEINQAVHLFDTPEKWSAFLALADQTENLRRAMYRTAFLRISSYFLKEHQAIGWSFKPMDPNELHMMWYLTQCGEFSVCLVLAWKGELVLEVRGGNNYHSISKTIELLQDPKYGALLACFDRIDEGPREHFMAREKFNFSFGSPSDTRFGPLRLAWYAQFETEALLQQIIAKIVKFQTPEMTLLLAELNELTNAKTKQEAIQS